VKTNHNNNFDLVRLFAASQVVLMHTNFAGNIPLLGTVLGQFPGVPIFYIVSGFLITHSYRREGGLGFYVRRMLRIYPALWVNVIAILLLIALTGSFAPDLTWLRFAEWLGVTLASGCDIYGTFVAGRIVEPNGFYQSFPTGVLWTITVELMFYLLLPAIVKSANWAQRFTGVILFGWWLASYVTFLFYQHLEKVAHDNFLTKTLSINLATDLWLFMFGVSAAIYWDRIGRFFTSRLGYWLLCYLTFALVEAYFVGTPGIGARIMTPFAAIRGLLLAGVVLAFAFTKPTMATILRGQDLSYGIYLYHYPIIATLAVLHINRPFLSGVIIIIGTLFSAASSWFFIERPALNSKRAVTDFFQRNFRRHANIAVAGPVDS